MIKALTNAELTSLYPKIQMYGVHILDAKLYHDDMLAMVCRDSDGTFFGIVRVKKVRGVPDDFGVVAWQKDFGDEARCRQETHRFACDAAVAAWALELRGQELTIDKSLWDFRETNPLNHDILDKWCHDVLHSIVKIFGHSPVQVLTSMTDLSELSGTTLGLVLLQAKGRTKTEEFYYGPVQKEDREAYRLVHERMDKMMISHGGHRLDC